MVTEAGAKALVGKARSLITLDMPPPALAIEMVSSSDTDRLSKERDYISKRKEYAEIGILEYWIIAPVAEVVLVLNLKGTTYVDRKFIKTDKVISSVMPYLELTAQQILSAEI